MAKIMEELEYSKATARRIIEHMRLYLDAPVRYREHHIIANHA